MESKRLLIYVLVADIKIISGKLFFFKESTQLFAILTIPEKKHEMCIAANNIFKNVNIQYNN